MNLFSFITNHYKKISGGSQLRSKLIRDGFGSLILRVLFILLSFLISIVLARILGTRGYGIYGYIFAIVSVLAIPAEFGLSTLVMRETSKNIVLGNFGSIKGIWAWSVKIVLIITLIIFISAFIFYFLWGNQFNIIYKTTFLWGILIVPLLALSNLRSAALRGLKRVVLGQIVESVIRPGSFLLIIFFIVFINSKNLSPDLAMGIQTLSVGLSFGVGTILLIYSQPKELKQVEAIYKSKIWLSSTFTLALVNGISLLNKWINLIILGLFVSSSQIGIYNVAIQISILASSGLQAVNLVVAPQFASLFVQQDHKRLQRLTTISARVVLVINLIITIFFILYGKLFLQLIYGSEYVTGYGSMLILLIGQFVNSATGSVAFLLNMTDNEKLTIRGSLTAVVINILLSFILSPLLGINGAAIASATSIAVSNIILWWLVYKHLRINSLAFMRLTKKK
ncbi:MAG: flippase [Chloroflexi bacterium HGW-Chloroflexi-3]|nr:MAG: flippase [Chloroflexi bacterium HGW-Chloroflexi-3]